jgi:hypothetical protein
MTTPHDTTEEVELGEKMQDVPKNVPQSDSADEAPLVRTQPVMTRAKWLACIALCFCYTTSFQVGLTLSTMYIADSRLAAKRNNRCYCEAH